MTSPTIVTLPTYPVATSATFALNSYGADLTPPLGGQIQRILRLGSRFSVDLQFPAMRYDIGRQWLARLNYAEIYPVAIGFPQRGFQPTSPGPLVVDGSGPNTGGQLGVRAGSNGFQLVAGQFFHVLSQATGRRYVHQLVADTALSVAGAATLGIVPLLRFAPQDGDAVEFVNPMIEGFLSGLKSSWTLELVRRVGIKFSLLEDR